jgi:dTDP-4-dehydrorhamnose reductase
MLRDSCSVILGLHHRQVFLERVRSKAVSLESVDKLLEFFDSVYPNIVIHTTGLTSVERCERNSSLAYHINTKLAANVARACGIRGIILIHISTDHLFTGEFPFVEESQPIQPLNIYGQSKGSAETKVLENCPNALIIRTNFYGWGPPYRCSFSDRIIKTLRKGQPLMLFEDVFFTPTIIEVLARSVFDLCRVGASGIYHVVGDERLSKLDFGLKVARHFELDIDLINISKLTDQPHLVRRPLEMSLSNQKTCSVLGRSLGNVDAHLVKLRQQEHGQAFREIQNL